MSLRVDRITDVQIGKSGKHVRLQVEADGEQGFIELPISDLAPLLPKLNHVSLSPSGEMAAFQYELDDLAMHLGPEGWVLSLRTIQRLAIGFRISATLCNDLREELEKVPHVTSGTQSVQ